MPAASAGEPSSTPRTSTPSSSGRPTDRRSRRATCAGATAIPSRGRSRRLAAPERLDPRPERGVRRQGEVEPLAHPVGVEPDQRAVRVQQRRSGRAGREGRRVLQRAGDAPAARPAERALHGRDEPERDARAAGRRGGGGEHRGPDRGRGRRPRDRRDAGRVGLDDRQVAVPVDALDGAAGGAAVGEADGDLATAEVVGIGEDAAVGDDDAGAAETGTDPDDGRADGDGDGRDGLLELAEHGHGDD